MRRLDECFLTVEKLVNTQSRTVIAIDGRCASGKSTAAKIIADRFGGGIIHMDHFFLPPELRTAERLSEPGGNLHRERFASEVISHLRDADGFAYRMFKCSDMTLDDKPIRIPPSKLIICEGSYSLHPSFGKYYDLSIFSDVSYDLQLKRILIRNGEAKLEAFKTRWIPMEERYFEGFAIKGKCDIVF